MKDENDLLLVFEKNKVSKDIEIIIQQPVFFYPPLTGFCPINWSSEKKK